MNSNCCYCNCPIFKLNNITTYCHNCDLVYIIDHFPYSLYENDLEIEDKYEEQLYK
jgi:uncharacterized Zn finger protein (UPF0148 family)